MFRRLRDLDLNKLFDTLKSGENPARSTRNRQKIDSQLGYQALEVRQLLHGEGLFPANDSNGTFGSPSFLHTVDVTSVTNPITNVEFGAESTIKVNGRITNDVDSYGSLHQVLQFKAFSDIDSSVTTATVATEVKNSKNETVAVDFELTISGLTAGQHDLRYHVKRDLKTSFGTFDKPDPDAPLVEGHFTRILVNTLPAPISEINVVEDVEFPSPSALASDIDGDKLVFKLVDGPGNGTVVINETTGTFTYKTAKDNSDDTRFTFSVSDTHITKEYTVKVNVTADIDDPTLSFTDDVDASLSPTASTTVRLSDSGSTFTNDNEPEFFGTAEKGGTLKLSFTPQNASGKFFESTTNVDSLGNWRIQTSTIMDGTYSIKLVTNLSGLSETNVLEAGDLVVDTVAPNKPFVLKIPENDNEAGLGVTSEATNFQFTAGQDDLSGLASYVVGINGESFSATRNLGPNQENVTTTLASIFPTGFDITDAENATTFFRVRTFDLAGNLSPPAYFWMELDQQAPVIVPPANPKTHLGATSKNIQLLSDQIKDSILPNPVITEQQPKIKVSVQDQKFGVRNNLIHAQLYRSDTVNGVTVVTPISVLKTHLIPPSGGRFGLHQTTTPINFEFIPIDNLALNQDHTLFVRVTDRAGNVTDSDQLNVHVSSVGDASLGAPGTPVSSSLYYLGATVQKEATLAETRSNVIYVDQPVPVGSFVYIDNQYVSVGSGGSGGGGGGGSTVGNLVKKQVRVGGQYRLELTKSVYSSEPDRILSLGSKVAWLRPWQMSFDKTTQTIWFSFEDGNGLGQLDPATGITKVYDISGGTSLKGKATSSNPHGAFFDFNSQTTPRVWFVYRNVDVDMPDQVAEVGYFDVLKEEYFTYRLTEENTTGTGGPFSEPLANSHAITVDDTGDVWFTAEEGGNGEDGNVIQLDFDNKDGEIDGNVGVAVVHQIPEGLMGRSGHFHIHGIKASVDERTGRQYIYFVEQGERARSGSNGGSDTVVAMLVPADANNKQDKWFSWTIKSEVTGGSQPLFVEIDDNETPGRPEDDRLILTDSGMVSGSGRGLVERLDIGNVIKEVQAAEQGNRTVLPPASSDVTFLQVSKIPGADTTAAGGIQAFADRHGTMYVADSHGGVIRVAIDEAAGQQHGKADVRTVETTPTSFPLSFSNPVEVTPLIIRATITEQTQFDLSGDDGVDHYFVGADEERLDIGLGGFRATLNATSVFYGSIAQSDHISTTVFAETARREMAVVKSPSTPQGAVEGRMAFQVMRDGTLVMTARADGQLLDTQADITELLNSKGNQFKPEYFKFAGDVSAIVDKQGRVHVVGKQLGSINQMIVMTYAGGWNSQNALANKDSWGLRYYSSAEKATGEEATGEEGSLLVGDPTSFIDDQTGEVRFTVTTNTGKLLLYRSGQYTPYHVAGNFKEQSFGKVGIVQQGAWTVAYGANQQGDLIEYGIKSDLSFSYSKKVDYDRVAGQEARDVKVFQDVEVVLTGKYRQVYATDGNSRLVHVEINSITGKAWAENVTKIIAESMNETEVKDAEGVTTAFINKDKSNDLAEGYFPFQEAYAGRVYSGLEVLVDKKTNTQFVYGTNGGELILFIKSNGKDWRAANLTNDIYSFHGNADGPDRGGLGEAPRARVSANNVFGSPGGYMQENGDRHVFQINKEGEVIEYYILAGEAIPRFHTQNINFVNDNRPGS